MARDDDPVSPDPRRAPARQDRDTDDTIQSRRMEAREVSAMMRAIRFAGFDLTDPDDERMMARMFVGGFQRLQRHDRWAQRRAGVVVWIMASIGGTIISLLGPELIKWLRHL